MHTLLSVVDLPGWTAIHSVGLSSHEYKRWGEIDFVVVSPAGVFALEVKGGRVARGEDGLWEFTDRADLVHRKIEGPFRQAESALVGLQRWVEARLPTHEHSAIAWGFGVAMPDIPFNVISPEWAPETVGDRDAMRSAESARLWLMRLARYWQEKTRRSNGLDAPFVADIVRLVRGEFERVPSLASLGHAIVERSDRLTEQQAWLVDLVPANPRVLVEGGAGTGKTFMAAEIARRASSDADSNVVIVVPRKNAALPFRGVVPDRVRIVTPDTWSSRKQADLLIVDEAQDLLSPSGLDALDSLVRGGLTEGRWVIFLDPNAQATYRGILDPAALEVVRDLKPVLAPLSRNLRNTFEIVRTVQEMTQADIGVSGGGHGPDATLDLIDQDADFPPAAHRIIDRLAAQQIPAQEIAVITWLDPSSVAAELDGRPFPTFLLSDDTPVPATPHLLVSDPAAFQGLEATYVILGPVPEPSDDASIASIYVASTRPRAALWYVARLEVAEALAVRAKMTRTQVREGRR